MKLSELIIGTRSVIADGTWDPKKDFRTKPFGAIIDLDIKGSYNARYKTFTVHMSINSSTQHRRGISSLRFNDTVHTHSVAITFKNITQDIITEKEMAAKLEEYNIKNTNGVTLKSLNDFVKLQQQYRPDIVPVEVTKDGSLILRTRITMNSECRVRCTCAHYYYTFAYYNSIAGAHIGESPANYRSRRKKKFKWRNRNLNGNVGLCKHLQLLVSYIMKNINGNGAIEINKEIISVDNDTKVNKTNYNQYDTTDEYKSRTTKAGKILKAYSEEKTPSGVDPARTKEEAKKEFKEYRKAVKAQKIENASSLGNGSEINDRKFDNEGY